MLWKVDISTVGSGACLERAKIEAMRKQCELIEEQNRLLKIISEK